MGRAGKIIRAAMMGVKTAGTKIGSKIKNTYTKMKADNAVGSPKQKKLEEMYNQGVRF